jgi:dTDP-4-amino-4,6-dideoxygalactose transaminase
MSDITAAIGLGHLNYLDEEIKLRQDAGNYYNTRIKELNLKGFNVYIANIIPDYCTNYNWQNYHVILSKKYLRDVVVEKLKLKGIGCKWDIQQIHTEPAITELYNKKNQTVFLPNTYLYHSQGLWLPFFAEISREQQDLVIKSLEEVLSEFGF